MKKMTALLTLTIALLAAIPVSAARPNRVSIEGRIRTVTRDSDGYRVTLDRGDSLFRVPDSVAGRRPLRVGSIVRFSGVSRGGYVWVDEVVWSGRPDADRDDDYLTGRVERVNRFEQRLWLRDDRGRTIEVDGRAIADDRRHRLDVGDLHRGDRVTLRGRCERGTFRAFRIENVSAR